VIARTDATSNDALTVCVINYQGADCISGTLEALRSVTASVREVMVVDNASTDGSLELIARDFPECRLIRLAENCGPAGARNIGFREAQADLILFVDNDVALAPETPARLARSLRDDPAVVLAMPRILYAHDPQTIQYDGAASHYVGLMSPENENRSVDSVAPHPRRIQSLVTACFLIDRGRWGDDSPFDERFGYLLEDHDLALRARIYGHEMLSVPSPCYHGEGTEGLSLRRGGRYADVRVRNLIRNRWLVLLKDYQARTLFVLAPFLALFEAFQFAGAVRKGWLRHWLSACGSVARNRRAIREDRRSVQARRRTRDREILTGGPLPFADLLLRGPLDRAAGGLMNFAGRAYWGVARHLL
jgi:GT2 family glycosyltransferase